MPEIFEQNNKLKIIEYGNEESVADIFSDMKEGFLNLFGK